MPEQNCVLETYHDHYKDTVELSKEARQRRNRSFILLCVLEAISFLLLRNPDMVLGILNESIQAKLETSIRFSNGILQTLVWTLVVYVLVRYIQDTVYVERQYGYLDSLEKKISALLGQENLFKREGENYLNNYPAVLNLIDLFYKSFIPILFTVINTVRIIMEWKSENGLFCSIVDSAVYVMVCILTIAYYFHIHKKTAGWFRRHFTWLQRIDETIHKVLKEV